MEDGDNNQEAVDAEGVVGSPFHLVLLAWMDSGRVVNVVGPVFGEMMDQQMMSLEQEVAQHHTR